MGERTLEVTVRRNPANDHDIYVGYDYLWPDGTSANVSMNCLCQVGRRAFFGDKQALPDFARLVLHYTPGWGNPRVPGRKYRQCVHRINEHGEGQFFLMTDIPTVFKFKPQDDARVLEWCGINQGPGDHQFEFFTEIKEISPCSSQPASSSPSPSSAECCGSAENAPQSSLT